MPLRTPILPLLAVAGLLLTVSPAPAQKLDDDLAKVWQSFRAGKFGDTVQQLDSITQTYASDPAFLAVRARVYYLRALSLVQMQNWAQVPQAVDQFEQYKANSPAAWSEELLFWKARAQVSTGNFGQAKTDLEDFLKRYGNSKRANGARLMIAMSLLQSQQWKEAAEMLAKLRANASAVEWGRFLLLEATARMNDHQLDKALELIDEGHGNLQRLGQITAFELLAVQLAEELANGPDKSQAIRILIRIPTREEIVKRQDEQLANLQQYYDSLMVQKPPNPEAGATCALIEQVKKERARFAAVPNFDSSIRFRLAQAFLDAGRYRETAFVLENMLDQLPADSVVEQGSETLAQCYSQIGRWDKVIEVAGKFAKKFPGSKGLPAMLLQKGLALQSQEKTAESNAVFDEFLQKYPNDPLAPNAAYFRAYNSVVLQDFSDAAKRFLEVQNKYPRSSVAAEALFWQAQALSMGHRSEEALPLYEAYIQKYPQGDSLLEARYRHAFTLYDLGQYAKAVPELEKFIVENPGNPNSAEGMLLLGDVYFGRHEYQKAIDLLLRVPRGVGGYAEEAWFKVGKYYKLAGDTDKQRALFEKFQAEFPNSPRLAEAIHQLGLTYPDDPAKQREIYWQAFDRFGNDPKQWGVTDILQSLVKASGTPELHDELTKRLGDIRTQAAVDKDKRTLALNAAWGLARAQRASDPSAADRTLVEAAPLAAAEIDNPGLLMDIAQAFQSAGKLDQALALYSDIRRWNPVSPFNQAIFANLGFIALDQGKVDDARGDFDRYFNETPAIDLRGKVMLKLAEIELASGHKDKAIEAYEKALEDKGVDREQKAAALLAIGGIYIDLKQPDKAIPYFQRIYILYGAFPEIVARAYLKSALAFELRGDSLAAARSYIEMLNLPDLADPKLAAYRSEAEKQLSQLPADVRENAQTLEKPNAAQPAAAR
jgi:TolA-binding protein